MPECLFFQNSALVRVVGQDGQGFTTQVLISSASPWIGELMTSVSPHGGEQCIILPDVPWKDISGLLIQSDPSNSKVMSDCLLDLLTTTDAKVIHNVEESQTILQKNIIGNFHDSVKQEECKESTFNEYGNSEDIGEAILNTNVGQNDFDENLFNNTVKLEEVQKESTKGKDEVKQIESSIKPNQLSLVSRSQKIIKRKIPNKEGKFKLHCEQCQIYFSTYYAFERHNKEVGHANLKKYKYGAWFKKTKYSKAQLYKILQSPNIHLYDLDKIEGIFSCNECSEKFAAGKALKEHKEKQHPEYFSCDYCEFTTTGRRELKSHRSSIHGDVSESCDMCDKKFKAKSLSRHKQEDHALVRFPCDQCDYKAKTRTTLKLHINSIHEKIVWTCDLCNKAYTHPRNLWQHQQSVHKGVYFMCDQCDYKATQRRNLQNHIEEVHEENQYPCGHCDYRGTTKRRLRYHIRKRHNEATNIITTVSVTTSTKAESKL